MNASLPHSASPAEPLRIASSKRCVLVVDRDGLAGRVSDALAGLEGVWDVTPTPSFLSAMGALAHRAADAVIGPVDALDNLADSAGRGLRELAPQAKLIVVGDEQQQALIEAALRSGFDAHLPPAFDRPLLADVLGVSPPPPAAPPASPPADETNDGLGDTDLVEAILHRKPDLKRTALQMINSQSGLTGVEWALDPAAIPASHAQTPVTYRDAAYGHLHMPGPKAGVQLEPWAQWLGHWLALDDQFHRLKHLAMRDELTGAWNRRYFARFLKRILNHARHDRSQVTLLVFDIDDFKLYNDKYGHAAGDEILTETAKLMQSVVREHDVVARIGGDEFAVIFWDAEGPRRPEDPHAGQHPQNVLAAAKRFQHAVCQHRFPKLLEEAPGALTISGGLASFPWDGATPEELLARADAMAMLSKKQGKNAITLGPGATRLCDPDAASE